MSEARTPLALVEAVADTGHRSVHRIPSVAIVGPGLVGATTAYGLLVSGAAAEIVLIGRDSKETRSLVSAILRSARRWSRR
jgi:hypothetical protein